MTQVFLDDQSFASLRDYIRDLTGIHFADSKRYLLENRLRRRADQAGVATAGEYLELLEGAGASGEIEALVDEITTNETSFFRHERQMLLLKEHVDELVAARRSQGRRRLRIWSAACASGEETYSVAMIASDAIEDLDGWDVDIVGTDISVAEIGRARDACYGDRQLRTLPDDVRRRYFEPASEPGCWSPVARLRRLVRFSVGSLLGAETPTAVDIVLCRNVLIYFDAPTKGRVLDLLYDAMAPGGTLVLGPSDSLHGLTDRFRRTPHSAYNFYRKPGVPPAHDPTPPAHDPTPARGNAPPAGTTPATSRSAGAATRPATDMGASLRSRMLVLRLDSGLRDICRDLDSSVGKTVERLTDVTSLLSEIGDTDGLDAARRAQIRHCARQLNQLFLYLQIGDRGQQKLEALRGLLQELSDRLFVQSEVEVDLQVRTSSYDGSILSRGEEDDGVTEGGAEEDRPLSQDDIDALFD